MELIKEVNEEDIRSENLRKLNSKHMKENELFKERAVGLRQVIKDTQV